MKHFLPFILLCTAVTASAYTKPFIADDQTNFANPERGFYTASEQDIKKTTTKSDLTDGAFNQNSGRSLILRQYVFSGFREDSLSQTALDIVEADFATFRRNGFKCVLRFSYTVDFPAGGPYEDGSPEIWKKHLEQLKPIMARNADVIATVQAGFLGVWGEWHYSSLGEGDKIPLEAKNALIDQLLDAVPVCRTVQLRTPKHKKQYIGDANPLTLEEAFTGTPRARLGHHNDAFLYGENNMGTYINRTKDMNYLDQECMYVPNGGESDVLDTKIYNKWATGKKAAADMAKVHFSYINQDYTPLVIGNWRKEGAFDVLARNMGYRFQLIEANLPTLVRPAETLPVQFTIRNVGYASMYNERKVYVALIGQDTTYLLPLESDPRLWAPNGVITEIDEHLTLPSPIREGTYQTAIYMPDVFPSIANNPRYAVRLANYNMWNDTTGYNLLNMPVLVSATEPAPEPTPEPIPEAGMNGVKYFGGRSVAHNAILSWTNPVVSVQVDTLRIDLSQGIDTCYNGPLGNSSATISYDNGVASVNYETKKAWLWAGVRFPVDNLKEVQTIAFEYKGDGQSVSMISYAHDGDYRWNEDENASVSLNSPKWQKYAFQPKAALWSAETPTHKYGDKPIIDLGFISNPMNPTKGVFHIRNLMVINTHQSTDNFAAVRVVRQVDAAPTSMSDGKTIYFGKQQSYVDKDLEAGHVYYYAAYTYGKDGRVSLPSVFPIGIKDTPTPTATDQVQEEKASAAKILCNGQLILIRNGVKYNVLGTAR